MEDHTEIDEPSLVTRAGDQPVSHVVIRAVEEVHDNGSEMRPLYDVLDPDALDALFEGRPNGTVRFRYGECRVTVDGNSEISVRPVDSDGSDGI